MELMSTPRLGLLNVRIVILSALSHATHVSKQPKMLLETPLLLRVISFLWDIENIATETKKI